MTDTKKNLSHKMSISTTEKLNSYQFNGLLLKKKISLFIFLKVLKATFIEEKL